jgi:hypothetical protein
MKKFVVSLARIEHRVYQIEVEANDSDEASDMAQELWEEDDEAFTDFGCVHAEEFINDVEEKQEDKT